MDSRAAERIQVYTTQAPPNKVFACEVHMIRHQAFVYRLKRDLNVKCIPILVTEGISHKYVQLSLPATVMWQVNTLGYVVPDFPLWAPVYLYQMATMGKVAELCRTNDIKLNTLYHVYLIWVFPTPGGPHTSVVLPRGIPPPSMASTFAQKVTMYPWSCSALRSSKADLPVGTPLE